VASAPRPGDLYITGDENADRLLNTDQTALLIGMLLDQQVPLEWAFAGPATLRRRIGHLDPARIAMIDEEAFVSICTTKPAIHRFPASMGRRIHALCTVLADNYPEGADALWNDALDGADLRQRLRQLPGFGDEKSKIFIALLAKRFGVTPEGWGDAAGVFADDTPRTIADIHDETSHLAVREWKQAQKSARRDKQDRPL